MKKYPLLLLVAASFAALGCGGEINWRRAVSSTNESLRLVQALSEDTALAVTFRTGRVLRTVDGGKNWAPYARFSPRRVETLLYSPDSTLMLAGYGQSVLVSTDFGKIWHPRALPKGTMLMDVAPLPNGGYLAVGKAFTEGPPTAYALLQAPGSETWTPIEMPTTEPALAAATGERGIFVAFGISIWSYDPDSGQWTARYTQPFGDIVHKINAMTIIGDEGIAVGDHGFVLTSHNGGKSWKLQHLGDESLYAVLIDGDEAWIGGDHHIWHRGSTHGFFHNMFAPNTGRIWDFTLLNGRPVAVGDGGTILLPQK